MKYITTIITCIVLMFAVSCKKETVVEPEKDGTEATTDTETAKPAAVGVKEEPKGDE